MSTHNIGFKKKWRKLSFNYHRIRTLSVLRQCTVDQLTNAQTKKTVVIKIKQYPAFFLKKKYFLYIEDIQMFLFNMAFISSSEVKNMKYTYEVNIFFTSQVKLKPYLTKKIEFSFCYNRF